MDEGQRLAIEQLMADLDGERVLAEFNAAEWWMVEMRDPTSSFRTRVGFWRKDEQPAALAYAQKCEEELNRGIGDDPPFEATVVPVFGRDDQ